MKGPQVIMTDGEGTIIAMWLITMVIMVVSFILAKIIFSLSWSWWIILAPLWVAGGQLVLILLAIVIGLFINYLAYKRRLKENKSEMSWEE